jgi:hypothetical protein
MKIHDSIKSEKFQRSFIAALVFLLFAIIPMWGEGHGKYAGAIAMLATIVIGSAIYLALFRERLGGQWKRVIVYAASGAAVAAALVIAIIRWH